MSPSAGRTASTSSSASEAHDGRRRGAAGIGHHVRDGDDERPGGVAGPGAGARSPRTPRSAGRRRPAAGRPARTARDAACPGPPRRRPPRPGRCPAGSRLRAASSRTRYDAETRAHGTPAARSDAQQLAARPAARASARCADRSHPWLTSWSTTHAGVEVVPADDVEDVGARVQQRVADQLFGVLVRPAGRPAGRRARTRPRPRAARCRPASRRSPTGQRPGARSSGQGPAAYRGGCSSPGHSRPPRKRRRTGVTTWSGSPPRPSAGPGPSRSPDRPSCPCW